MRPFVKSRQISRCVVSFSLGKVKDKSVFPDNHKPKFLRRLSEAGLLDSVRSHVQQFYHRPDLWHSLDILVPLILLGTRQAIIPTASL